MIAEQCSVNVDITKPNVKEADLSEAPASRQDDERETCCWAGGWPPK
jgi:hypothetical protein